MDRCTGTAGRLRGDADVVAAGIMESQEKVKRLYGRGAPVRRDYCL